jgi:hypothetical protein
MGRETLNKTYSNTHYSLQAHSVKQKNWRAPRLNSNVEYVLRAGVNQSHNLHSRAGPLLRGRPGNQRHHRGDQVYRPQALPPAVTSHTNP